MDQGACKRLEEAFPQMKDHRRELLKTSTFLRVEPSLRWSLDSMVADLPLSALAKTSTPQKTEGTTLSHLGKSHLS